MELQSSNQGLKFVFFLGKGKLLIFADGKPRLDRVRAQRQALPKTQKIRRPTKQQEPKPQSPTSQHKIKTGTERGYFMLVALISQYFLNRFLV